jgi:hypothetical protein
MQYFQVPKGNLNSESNFALKLNVAFEVGKFGAAHVIAES